MRYLFFLVLLINVIFFLWQWRSEALKPITESKEDSIFYEHEIILVSELESSQKNNEMQLENPSIDAKEIVYKKSSQPSENTKNEWVCYDFGPFEDKTQILQWDEQNPIKAEDISFYLKDVEVVSGYLLFYPAADSLLRAQDNVAILEAKGVENLWLFKFGDMKGAISLGFFDTEAEAKDTQKSLEKIGVDAKIKTHSKVKDHTFATITWKKNKGVYPLISNYKEKFPEQGVKKLSECSISKPVAQVD